MLSIIVVYVIINCGECYEELLCGDLLRIIVVPDTNFCGEEKLRYFIIFLLRFAVFVTNQYDNIIFKRKICVTF